MSSYTELLDRAGSKNERRAYIKRRSATTGLYEPNWTDITEWVTSYGSTKRAVDDIRLNRFTHDGVTLTCRNDYGKFNKEDNLSSLWSGYLTRYRTLLKVTGGYLDSDFKTVYPSDPTVGIFIMSDEISVSGLTNVATIQATSVASVFNEVMATEVKGLGTTQTASEIISKIRDHTDGSFADLYVFRQFITQTAWTIQSTTSYYNLATTTSLDGLTCWELMEKLAECEGYVLLINRTGGIEFRDREARTTTVSHAFGGVGAKSVDIISLDDYRESFNKYFNYVRFKFKSEDTSTSYVTSGTITTVSPASLSWKYGTRVYELENTFVPSTATAQAISDGIYTENATLKDELAITTKFIPHVEVLDRVSVTYKTTSPFFGSVYDVSSYDAVDYDLERGDNFLWDAETFKVISVEHNLDAMRSKFVLREE